MATSKNSRETSGEGIFSKKRPFLSPFPSPILPQSEGREEGRDFIFLIGIILGYGGYDADIFIFIAFEYNSEPASDMADGQKPLVLIQARISVFI